MTINLLIGEDKRTSLHFAGVVGDDKVVELLIQHGVDVHLTDR